MADRVLFEDKVDKYSLGRSTGLTARNWKSRHMRLTKMSLAYSENANAVPKLEIPVTAISVLFTDPDRSLHPEAKGNGNFLMVRLFDGGVFDLLIKCPTPETKQKWIASFKEALERSKGSQIV
eukprot:CAMPEP_0174835356 /NCGR_PEP_ID=MMETSP1114-20130205/5366_1 /TAXON_ID=312471 /ORGANISM="Neobodo designis, Strain CCAP 1951/1" /LENGTH=122 /DNA_ID=CAMNT_0016069303 /DNA_START=67 /DNA_END=435 /DNA_ORIENTATION=-